MDGRGRSAFTLTKRSCHDWSVLCGYLRQTETIPDWLRLALYCRCTKKKKLELFPVYWNRGSCVADTADSVSRELVEAGLVDGRDMVVGTCEIFRLFQVLEAWMRLAFLCRRRKDTAGQLFLGFRQTRALVGVEAVLLHGITSSSICWSSGRYFRAFVLV